MQLVLGLVETYGYIVVALVVMAESAGLPVPGETSLLVAAALAATGKLSLPGVIIAAALGAIIGDTAGYWVGRTTGLRLLQRYGRWVRFDEAKLERAEAFFARHGEKTVFLGRFVPVGRIFSALLAGVGRMRYDRFLLWNASGGIVWATIMGTLGFVFGRQLPLIERLVRQFGFGLLFLVVAFVAVRLAWPRRQALLSWVRRAARGVSLPGGVTVQRLALLARDPRRLLHPRYRWYWAAGGLGLTACGGIGAALLLVM